MMRAPGAATIAATRGPDRAEAPVPTSAPPAAAQGVAPPRTAGVEAIAPAGIVRTGNSGRGAGTNAQQAPGGARFPTVEGVTNARNDPPEGLPDRAPGAIGPLGARTTGVRGAATTVNGRRATVRIAVPRAPAVHVRNAPRVKAAAIGAAKAEVNDLAAMTVRTAHHARHGRQRRAAIGTATTAVPRRVGKGPPPVVAGVGAGATARWTAVRR